MCIRDSFWVASKRSTITPHKPQQVALSKIKENVLTEMYPWYLLCLNKIFLLRKLKTQTPRLASSILYLVRNSTEKERHINYSDFGMPDPQKIQKIQTTEIGSASLRSTFQTCEHDWWRSWESSHRGSGRQSLPLSRKDDVLSAPSAPADPKSSSSS